MDCFSLVTRAYIFGLSPTLIGRVILWSFLQQCFCYLLRRLLGILEIHQTKNCCQILHWSRISSSLLLPLKSLGLSHSWLNFDILLRLVRTCFVIILAPPIFSQIQFSILGWNMLLLIFISFGNGSNVAFSVYYTFLRRISWLISKLSLYRDNAFYCWRTSSGSLTLKECLACGGV